jgi:hypothetical protein
MAHRVTVGKGLMTLHDQPDTPLTEAILRTLLYADIFNFPLTETEIHHFLIGFRATPAEIRTALRESLWLAAQIEFSGDYYALRGRGEAIQARRARAAASASLWPLAQRYGQILAHLPFVRMVALTGALAMRNARNTRDDIDFLIVTEPGRVWLARALAVLIVKIARLRGVWLCPNYVLARTALDQERRDLYMAHEIAQMIPLAGHDLYVMMRRANAWTDDLLPNAAAPYYHERDRRPHGIGRLLQRLGELLLSGPPGNALERWEQRRKQRKFSADARKKVSNSAARLDDKRVKGHFNDHGMPVMVRYQASLEAYQLVRQTERELFRK